MESKCLRSMCGGTRIERWSVGERRRVVVRERMIERIYQKFLKRLGRVGRMTITVMWKIEGKKGALHKKAARRQ